MSHRNKVVVAILIAVIIFTVLLLSIKPVNRTLLNILGIVGFLLSVLGIVIAYFQITSVRDIAKATQRIAQETQNDIRASIQLNNNILMISDLSRKVAVVHEIQGYLKDDKIELCILRMHDLKVSLNTIKNLPYYNSLTNKKEFNAIFGVFNSDLDLFQGHAVNNKKKINKEGVLKNLEVLSTVFQSVEIKLKNQSHDS